MILPTLSWQSLEDELCLPSAQGQDGEDTTKEDRSRFQETWVLQAYILLEVCIYSIYLLDSQLSIACNLRPQISALEIKYELPCADDLWSATTADAWHTARTQHFRSFNEQDDRPGAHDDDAAPTEGSLYSSTQDLLHHRRSRPSLRLLWYSPFAALVLVTQLQMMSRELTHASCLLERPKNTQRHLSILTEAQYNQISCALRNIAELAPRSDPAGAHPLWHAFWLTYHYTSLTLSHPDSLLVTGVVETNLPAAIATAGHLARPRSRRANRDIYEDRDVFRILNDLEAALGRMAAAPGVEGENPFLTLLAFKICLVGWRVVRLTMGEAGRGEEAGQGRCNPSRFVLQSVMAAIREGRGEEGGAEGALEAEVEYLQWVREALLRRSVWPVGRWEAAIVDEAVAGAGEYAAGVRESEG
ncbi:Zinc finger C2H2-type protein [Neofusicoccum parvum]|uniref:Zinc finger C2H2-type protein n=1 Tax=Neofusicoccum parvum TaxID=310453 RepID=A0ACB5SJE3_9PEZI|nr:Zinc finger C2H2-type protein [Neofusicoccum parvum]